MITNERTDDSVVKITEGGLGRGQRTVFLEPGGRYRHADDDPSFCNIEVLVE